MGQPPPPPPGWSPYQDQPPPYQPPGPPYGPPGPPGPPGPYDPYQQPPPPPPPGGGNGKIIGIVAAVAAVVVLGCGALATVSVIWYQRATAPTETIGAPSPVESGPVESGPVDWLTSEQAGGDPISEVWPGLADEFEADHGEIVEIEQVLFEEYAQHLEVRTAAGDAPDLFQTSGGSDLRDLVEDGLVRDITDDLADVVATIAPGALEPYTVDGRVYGLPYHTGMVGLWYNRDLFAEAGLDPDSPPATWSEFEATVDALSAAGIAPVALGGQEDWTVGFWFGYLATRTAGVDGLAEARDRRSYDDPDLLRAADLLADLAGGAAFQEGFATSTYTDAAFLVRDGEAAMELMGPWAPGVYGQVPDDLGWFRFPAVEGGRGTVEDGYGGGDGFAVGADAPGTAVELLRFLFDDPSYRQIMDVGGNVPVKSGVEVADPAQAPVQAAVAQAPAFQLYLDRDLPPAVGQAMNQSMAAVALGTMTPEEALAEITNTFQQEPD